jgi:hypothetical protein
MSPIGPGAAVAAAYARYNHLREAAPIAPKSADLSSLEVRLEQQNLLIQTLLMLLLEKKVIHEDEFKEWMIYVDELDGVRDGRVKAQQGPITCPSCKRNNPRTAVRCQYCGNEFPPEFLAHPTTTGG